MQAFKGRRAMQAFKGRRAFVAIARRGKHSKAAAPSSPSPEGAQS
jgi:hypothetical protein